MHGPDHGQNYPFGKCELHGDVVHVSSGPFVPVGAKICAAAADHQKPFDYLDEFSAGGDVVGGACRVRLMFRALETTKRSVNKKKKRTHTQTHARESERFKV